MKLRLVFLGLGALLVASTAQAQRTGTGPTPQERREAFRARREAMAQNQDAIRERREALHQRLENLTPEQKAFFEALRTERKDILSQVKAGTLTRQEARAALRAWIQANRPPRPES